MVKNPTLRWKAKVVIKNKQNRKQQAYDNTPALTSLAAQRHSGQQRGNVFRLHGRELREGGEDYGQVPRQLPPGVHHPAA